MTDILAARVWRAGRTALFERFLVDRVTFVAIAYRLVPALAALVVILLIARHYTLGQQAFYYMVANAYAILQLSDLGLSVVLIQFSSHEWSRIKRKPSGDLEGDPSALARLRSIVTNSRRWYGLLAGIYFVLVGAGGYRFFQLHQSAPNWRGPWFVLVPLFSIILFYTHRMAVLEGCGQVRQVYTARLIYMGGGFAALAAGLIAGFGTWAICLHYAVIAIVSVYFCEVKYGGFFGSLARARGAGVAWRTEVWPLQWSFSINAMVGYFLFQIYVPIVLLLTGAAAAGRTGMTVQITNLLGGIGAAVITSRVPTFGGLIAHRQFESLNRLFYRTCITSSALTGVGGIALILALWLAGHYHLAVANRMLPLAQTALFLAAVLAGLPSQLFGYYLIAHKRNPMLVMAVVAGVCNLTAVFVLVKFLGTLGAGLAALGVNAIIVAPWHFLIWQRSRRSWHAPGV